MKGTVFSIEEFALNDGPGIRTTVFLKGCPLRCVWCHNPEGLSPYPQIMHMRERDVVCGREIEAEELASKLLRDERIFKMNGGGVTFTGGEPTMQPLFLCEMLERLSRIHTAIETCGFCPEKVFERVLERVDLVLFDIKHTDPAMHLKYTGKDNASILRNLDILKYSGKPFVIRVPMIPAVNDTKENLAEIDRLLQGASGLERIELMRYHKTAGAKYKMVDMEYNPPFDTEVEPIMPDNFTTHKTIVLC